VAKRATKHPGVWSLGGRQYLIVAWGTSPKTGRRKKLERTIEADSASAAAKARAALRGEIESPARSRERVRLSTYVESWLRRKLPAWKASTATQNASVLQVHVMPALGDYWLDALDDRDIVAWRDAMATEAEAVSVNSRLRLLRQVLRDAAHDYGIANPASRVEPIRLGYVDRDQREYIPDAGEARALLAWLRANRPQWYPLVELLAYTGLRFGEATALRWTDVDFEGGWIHVRRAQVRGVVDHPKSSAGQRSVVLTPELAETLRAYQTTSGRLGGAYVFLGTEDNLLSASVLHAPMAKACEEVGLPWERVPAVKVWRKVHNNLLRQVTSEVVRQELVGHADAEVGRKHYSQVSDEEKRAAVGAVLKLVRGE
jgi:integrase